jgi:hypothetical protein
MPKTLTKVDAGIQRYRVRFGKRPRWRQTEPTTFLRSVLTIRAFWHRTHAPANQFRS